jgi:hypothetical protein
MIHRNPIPIAHRSRALSSVYGKIEQILVSIDGDFQSFSRFRLDSYYKDLFVAFSDRVSFVVLGHFGKESEQALRNALVQEGLDPDLVQVHTPLADTSEPENPRQQGVFVQDPFVIMESQHGDTLLLEPYRGQLEQNAYLAEQFADTTGFALLPTRYILEGGNILVGDDYAFIGRNHLERNRRRFFPDKDPKAAEAIITADLRRALGMRYLFWIGSEQPFAHPLQEWSGPEAMQPFYHLDFFLTLGGKSKSGDEIVLLAEIDISSFGEDLTPEQTTALMQMNASLNAVKNQLQAFSDDHRGPKFLIEEIPMSGKISGSGDKLHFVPYSYNNAQVEWYHGISRIYLPKFPNRKAVEDRLRENLPGLGFSRITFIEYDMEQFALRKGGLHCLTKVLRRSAY